MKFKEVGYIYFNIGVIQKKANCTYTKHVIDTVFIRCLE